MKNCPYCGEQIADEAKKCRFCNEWLDSKKDVSEPIHKAYAGFWLRFFAHTIDTVIVVIMLMIAYALFGNTKGFIIAYILYFGYFIFMTYYYSATFGKMIVGIEVLSDGFKTASLGSIVLRETIGKGLSGLIIMIGYLMAGFTIKKQALHDMIASTVVVQK